MFEDASSFAPPSFGQATPGGMGFSATPTPNRPVGMDTPRLSVGGIKPNREKQAVIPVTCHLLQKTAFQSFQLEGSDPSIYGMPLTTAMVCFSACIEERKVEQTSVNWKLDDGTGTITAKKYSSDDEEKASFLIANEFTYVKVVGRLVTDRKTQSWYISVINMRPLTDGDDLALGIMEAFHTAMNPPTDMTGGLIIKTEPGASPQPITKDATFAMSQPELARPIKTEPVEIKKEPVDAPAFLKPEMGVRAACLEVVKAGGELGKHMGEIKSLLAANFAADIVEAAVKSLEEDGECWNTKDCDWFGCV